ncbi:hypothetical protein SLEP1_g30374 [Rubroshorea leprosula]|uniref:Uncharacterized protein n=1 Tax=Rubroshorea leprosula TaxID=152421 RepID=A0AAV5K937_9ROSI|nr:hypothetical protein SLEP1_g30374 [Rubroshorea leprosula]
MQQLSLGDSPTIFRCATRVGFELVERPLPSAKIP